MTGQGDIPAGRLTAAELAALVDGLAGRFAVESAGPVTLPGVGTVELARIVRPDP